MNGCCHGVEQGPALTAESAGARRCRAYPAGVAKRSTLPSICVDEQLPSDVEAGFLAQGFRTIRAAESRQRAQDERDYLGKMYARNEVFVTADGELVDDLADSGFKRHAGVVWVPKGLGREPRDEWVEMAAEFIRYWANEFGRFGMRGLVLYPAKAGVQVWDGDEHHLIASWDRLAA